MRRNKKVETLSNKRLEKVLNDDYWKFDLKELVCPHVYDRYIVKLCWTEFQVWSLFRIELLETLLFVRKELDLPMTVNTWHEGGRFDERGLRCHLCDLVKSKDESYLSAHVLAEGIDFVVSEMNAEEVRVWLEDNAERLPYPIRVEDGKPWVHLDMRTYRPAWASHIKVYRLTA